MSAMKTNGVDENVLAHYGVLGMKWGIRKDRRSSSGSSKKKTSNQNESSSDSKKSSSTKTSRTKNPKKMSEQELRARIQRLQLEKQYRDLKSSEITEGKKLVNSILRDSAKNIGTQLTTYGMGKLVNKILYSVDNTGVVNPKKGQRDKK